MQLPNPKCIACSASCFSFHAPYEACAQDSFQSDGDISSHSAQPSTFTHQTRAFDKGRRKRSQTQYGHSQRDVEKLITITITIIRVILISSIITITIILTIVINSIKQKPSGLAVEAEVVVAELDLVAKVRVDPVLVHDRAWGEPTVAMRRSRKGFGCAGPEFGWRYLSNATCLIQASFDSCFCRCVKDHHGLQNYVI